MNIKGFFDPRTYTITYVIWDEATRDAVILDPVLDYDPAASKTWTESVDVVAAFAEAQALNVRMILETHAHADHLSGSQLLKERFPDARLGVSRRITAVQHMFKMVFNLPEDFPTDGSQFDVLLDDWSEVEAGSLRFEVIPTPGHTPACTTFRFEDAIFTGDAMFMPDSGTGRCDFPGGSARDLYRSIKDHLYTLPEDTRVFVGHDYQPGGREVAWETTIGEQKAHNIQLTADTPEADYIAFRTKRDATLNAPKLLFQSVQVNVDAGHLPKPSDNQLRYLRIPLNAFRPEPQADAELELRGV